MVLNTAETLRRRLNDRPRLGIENYYGDGTANTFQISGVPIVTGCTSLGSFQPSALVPVGASWSGTGATFDYNLGLVHFSAAPSANSAFQVMYTYGTFSDQEIDQVTAIHGSFQDMQLDLIDTLMADAYRRARWASQRGAYFDDQGCMANLMMMRSAVFASKVLEVGPIGGIVGWSRTQSDTT
jgi:hypothetical protein